LIVSVFVINCVIVIGVSVNVVVEFMRLSSRKIEIDRFIYLREH